MDVDETQKIEDLSVIDQLKNKNANELIDQVCILLLNLGFLMA